jgi:hypothetical protein
MLVAGWLRHLPKRLFYLDLGTDRTVQYLAGSRIAVAFIEG